MNKKIIMLLTFLLVFILITPLNEIYASSKKVVVTTKILSYKGQEYLQLVGGNKTATNKINKVLKQHAVQTAIWSSENKKDNNGYNSTSPSVKYNKNEIISVVYADVVNVGGSSKIRSYTAYNFDLKTGNSIKLNSIIKTQNQKDNLSEAVKSSLLEKYKEGISIEQSVIDNIPLDDAIFYYYDGGIIIRFNRYIVSMTEDFIDIKVPLTTINKSNNVVKLTGPLKLTLNDATKSELEKGKIPGFGGISFGMSQKQISDILNKKPVSSYVIYGGKFWGFEGYDYVGFNFNEYASEDKLSYVQIAKSGFDFKSFEEVKKILGKPTKEYFDDNVSMEYLVEYKFGKISVEFSSVSSSADINLINVYQN